MKQQQTAHAATNSLDLSIIASLATSIWYKRARTAPVLTAVLKKARPPLHGKKKKTNPVSPGVRKSIYRRLRLLFARSGNPINTRLVQPELQSFHMTTATHHCLSSGLYTHTHTRAHTPLNTETQHSHHTSTTTCKEFTNTPMTSVTRQIHKVISNEERGLVTGCHGDNQYLY